MTSKRKLEHKGRIIRAEMRTTATPQQAWEAWANPEKISQWFTDKAEGRAEAGETITWIFEKFFNYRIPYHVLESVPGESFAIEFRLPERSGILEVTIAKEGGETVVRLVNSGFEEGAEWDEEYEGVVSGWQMALGVLRHYLEHYFGQPRSTFLVLRPARFTYEQLLPYYREPDLLTQWLTTSGVIGERCSLALRDGGSLTGRVLAITSREVAVSWGEIRGVLEFKAFSMGPAGRMLGLRVSAWNPDPSRAAEIEKGMTAAVDRLVAALSEATG